MVCSSALEGSFELCIVRKYAQLTVADKNEMTSPKKSTSQI